MIPNTLLIVHCLFSRSVLHGGLGKEAGCAGQWWERRGASWRGMPWAALLALPVNDGAP